MYWRCEAAAELALFVDFILIYFDGIYCDSLIVILYDCIKIWILALCLLIILTILLDSLQGELSNGGFIVDFDLKMAFLDSPCAAEFGELIGILHRDWEELTGEFPCYRPFGGL